MLDLKIFKTVEMTFSATQGHWCYSTSTRDILLFLL